MTMDAGSVSEPALTAACVQETSLSASADAGMAEGGQGAMATAAPARSMRIMCVLPSSEGEGGAAGMDSITPLDSLLDACEELEGVRIEQVDSARLRSTEKDGVVDRLLFSDIVVIDTTAVEGRADLFYYVGLRESLGRQKNIVLFERKQRR